MKSEEIVKMFMGAIEAKDVRRAGTHLADNFVFEGPVPVPLSKQQFINMMTSLTAGIPNWSFNTSKLLAKGTKVEADVRISGTHTQALDLSFMGLPTAEATRKSFKLPAEKITFTLAGEKISAIKVKPVPEGGVPGILRQLGIAMQPEPAQVF